MQWGSIELSSTVTPEHKSDVRRANRALDAANFFLADVRDGLGPYLAIYLLTEQRWDEASIGVVMSIATVAGLLAQTPAGALVDATKAKRAIMVLAAIMVTAASLALPWLASFWPVAISQAIAHASGVVLGPALAAVTLGILDIAPSPAGSGVTRASTMPATLALPARPGSPPTFGDRASCSICWQPWRWQACSVC
jgi:MFS family permease